MKMTKIHSKYLVLSIVTIVALWSCSGDDASPDQYQLTVLSNTVEDLFEVTGGNANSDTVWIYEQGGPEYFLVQSNHDASVVNELVFFPNYFSYQQVQVHQILSYRPDLSGKELTVEQAETETDMSIEILDRVIRHYKDQGKTVFVFGHSYGAFTVTRYLAQKGSQSADKFVIMAGRLDVQEEAYMGYMNKVHWYFPDYVTPTIHPTRQSTGSADDTRLFFNGIIAKPRYTQLLSNVDLSNLMYVAAADDDRVGAMSLAEEDFLILKGAEYLEVTGGHSAMLEDSEHRQTIYDWLRN